MFLDSRCMKLVVLNVKIILKIIALKSANSAKLGILVAEENFSTLMEFMNNFDRVLDIVGPEILPKWN